MNRFLLWLVCCFFPLVFLGQGISKEVRYKEINRDAATIKNTQCDFFLTKRMK